MSDATVDTALSKARYLAPNLAYSLALQDSPISFLNWISS